jgi:outer membrane receptor protein involved in Fe transport
MKKLLMLCAFIFALTIQAQTSVKKELLKSGTITGRVLDATLNEPLPYVSIVIKNANGDILTGGITDDNGKFKIESIPEGKHNVSIQYVGYKTVTLEATISKNNYKVDLGTIKIEETATGLDEVTIVAETSTIQQKVDRKVITIGKDLAATGTASELMVGIPSVSIDQQTGDISLRGNQNVRVMVDGKLSNVPTAQLLRQIPSTAIKSIELITNPSAKYNPEGMSGIINIVLHKNTMVGFNGNFSIGLAYEEQPKFNSALGLNYRNGKFNIYGNYSNNISKNQNRGLINRPGNNSQQLFSFLDDRKSHLYKVGLDFYLNDKNTISVFTNQNVSDNSTDGSTKAFFFDNTTFNQSQTFISAEENSSSQYNFDYKLDLAKEGHNLELEVDYNVFDSENPLNYKFQLGDAPDFRDFNKTDRERTTINLDYANPLSETTKLELGVQARLFNTDIGYASTGESFNSEGVLRQTPSTDFDYTRDIYSAYASFSKKFEKWTYQIGARLESVTVDAVAVEREVASNAINTITFTNDYFEIYPSAFFTYTPSEKNSYQLSYSRRVDRPGIGQVNPIREWATPLLSSFGNINLEPQFTNSVEVNYTRQLEKGTVTGGVFYRLISDEINRALFVDRTDVNSGRLILTHDNFDDTTAFGFELSTNYRPTNWWSINGSFDLYTQKQKGISERLDRDIEIATVNDIITDVSEVDNIAWNFRMFNSFKATKTLSFTAFGFYRGKNRTLQFDLEPMYFVNLGARISFAEGKGSFSLNYNDVFDTMEFAFDGKRPFRQVGGFNWESNTIQGSLTYRFGGGKYKAKSRKDRDDNEKSGGGFL